MYQTIRMRKRKEYTFRDYPRDSEQSLSLESTKWIHSNPKRDDFTSFHYKSKTRRGHVPTSRRSPWRGPERHKIPDNNSKLDYPRLHRFCHYPQWPTPQLPPFLKEATLHLWLPFTTEAVQLYTLGHACARISIATPTRGQVWNPKEIRDT